MFADAEAFAVRLFWLIVSVFIALIVGNVILQWFKARGGFVGNLAGNIENLADPD